jgi:hypothetical protein
MKSIISKTILYSVVIKWMNMRFGDLTPYETDRYPDYIFFIKDKEIIFDYNKKNGQVYISYYNIWSLLEDMFGMEYEQIQEVTKLWLEEHYNLRVTTTQIGGYFKVWGWRNITI